MSCEVCQIGNRASSMDWLMKVFQNIDTLPVLLMNYLWGRKQKWYRVSTALRLYSLPERPTLRHLLRTKIIRVSCRKRTGVVVPRADNFGE